MGLKCPKLRYRPKRLKRPSKRQGGPLAVLMGAWVSMKFELLLPIFILVWNCILGLIIYFIWIYLLWHLFISVYQPYYQISLGWRTCNDLSHYITCWSKCEPWLRRLHKIILSSHCNIKQRQCSKNCFHSLTYDRNFTGDRQGSVQVSELDTFGKDSIYKVTVMSLASCPQLCPGRVKWHNPSSHRYIAWN